MGKDEIPSIGEREEKEEISRNLSEKKGEKKGIGKSKGSFIYVFGEKEKKVLQWAEETDGFYFSGIERESKFSRALGAKRRGGCRISEVQEPDSEALFSEKTMGGYQRRKEAGSFLDAPMKRRKRKEPASQRDKEGPLRRTSKKNSGLGGKGTPTGFYCLQQAKGSHPARHQEGGGRLIRSKGGGISHRDSSGEKE